MHRALDTSLLVVSAEWPDDDDDDDDNDGGRRSSFPRLVMNDVNYCVSIVKGLSRTRMSP